MNLEKQILEQNVFFVKRKIVDYIWKSANLEGIAVAFPDTQAIYKGSDQSPNGNPLVSIIYNFIHFKLLAKPNRLCFFNIQNKRAIE